MFIHYMVLHMFKKIPLVWLLEYYAPFMKTRTEKKFYYTVLSKKNERKGKKIDFILKITGFVILKVSIAFERKLKSMKLKAIHAMLLIEMSKSIRIIHPNEEW